MTEGRAVWTTRDRAEAAEARVKALEDRLASATNILRLHNQTATGMTIKCLDRCIACEFIANPLPRRERP